MDKRKKNIVIIGAGQAGVACAESIRALDKKRPITIIDDDKDAFYYRASLKYFIKGKFTKEKLHSRPKDYFEKNKIERINGTVIDIKPNEKSITINTESNITLTYEKLIIASGTKPIIPEIDGINANNVYPMRTLEDTQKIIESSNSCLDKNGVVVLGGGVLGLELADALRDRYPTLKITLIVREERIGYKLLDKNASEIISDLLRKKNIEIIPNQSIKQIIPREKEIEGVIIQNGNKLECSAVYICTGVKAELEFAKNAGIKVNNGILVNEYLETSIKDIFAIGDVAEITTENQSITRRLWAFAGLMGKTVAANLDGKKMRFNPGTIHVYTILCDKNYHGIGDYDPNDSKYEILISNDAYGNYLKFVLLNDVLVGCVILGEAKDPITIKKLIENQTVVTDHLKQELTKKEFDYEILLYMK